MQRNDSADSAIHELVIQKIISFKKGTLWNQSLLNLMGNLQSIFFYVRKNRRHYARKMRHIIFRQWGGNYI